MSRSESAVPELCRHQDVAGPSLGSGETGGSWSQVRGRRHWPKSCPVTLSSGGLLMRVGCRWGGSGTVKSRKLREGSWRLQAGSACPFGRLGGKANPRQAGGGGSVVRTRASGRRTRGSRARRRFEPVKASRQMARYGPVGAAALSLSRAELCRLARCPSKASKGEDLNLGPRPPNHSQALE